MTWAAQSDVEACTDAIAANLFDVAYLVPLCLVWLIWHYMIGVFWLVPHLCFCIAVTVYVLLHIWFCICGFADFAFLVFMYLIRHMCLCMRGVS